MIINLFRFLAQMAKGKVKCPKCGSKNTVSHEDGWRNHCFDCGHSWG